MAKLNRTYLGGRCYYKMDKGEIFTQYQLERKISSGEWEVHKIKGGFMLIDFTELDGTRADWLQVGGKYGRFIAVPTRSPHSYEKLWLVTETSYQD